MLALTLPAETILLKALQADETQAVSEWVTDLSSTQLAEAADGIRFYPLAYRRGIMARLSPDARASAWQRHIRRYVNEHPELDGGTLDLLRAAQSALTSRALSAPTAEDRASIHAVASQVEKALGRDTAEFLLYRIGPRDGTFASLEPISMKVVSMVRNQFVLAARNWDCECSTGFGCSGAAYCTSEEYCQWDVEWPMCGWMWSDLCDGMCMGY